MSSGNHFNPLYGPQPSSSAGGNQSNAIPPHGMGSLQNMSRAGTNSLSQLSRGPTAGSPVGGGRITPTAMPSSSAAISSGMSGLFSGGPGSLTGFPSQTSNRQTTLGGVNLLQSGSTLNSLSSFSFPSSAHAGGGRLFSRDKSRFGDSLLSPNAFDPTEFPSLGSRENSTPNPSLSARSNYVGMVKQPTMETSEFTMSHEDFPALPGVPSMPNSGHHTSSSVGATAIGDGANSDSIQMKLAGGIMGSHQHQDLITSATVSSFLGASGTASSTLTASASGDSGGSGGLQPVHQSNARRGIQTSPDGRVTNIPPSMVTDQFGMIGLLTFIRAAETDPNLVSLALGADLTTLGLNLNSEVSLYPTFGGPWAETPCRPQDIDFHVPFEYMTNTTIRDKLAPVKLNRYKDDVLFYMFYTNVGDVLQLAAAAELYNRDWRYHKDDRVWITRAPGLAPLEKTSTYERGTYYFFDVSNWRKVSKEFHVDYDKLEERPSLPTSLSTGNSASGGSSVNTSSMTMHQQMAQQPTSSSSPAPPGMSSSGVPSSVMSGLQGVMGQPASQQQQQAHSPVMSVSGSGGSGPSGAPTL